MSSHCVRHIAKLQTKTDILHIFIRVNFTEKKEEEQRKENKTNTQALKILPFQSGP